MVDNPVGKRPGAGRVEIAGNWLDGFKRGQYIHFKACKHAHAAQTYTGFVAERLALDNFPLQAASDHFGAR
jgi:hypothetical protein